MLNRIILIGRLTRDPELRFTTNGTAVCSFTLAVDSGFGENKRTDFINIVVWNKQGENCATYLSKGKLAAVDGRLQIRSYDGKDGVKRYVTEVVAESVRFLSPKGETSSEPLGSSFGAPPMSGGMAGAPSMPEDDGFPMTDDDLPF